MSDSRRVAESVLYEIAEYLGQDWFKLGLELGIPSHRVEQLGQPALPANAYPRQMLNLWYKKNGGESISPELELCLKKKLRDELIRCYRRDLSEKVRHDQDFPTIFTSLMDHLMSEWEKLGVYLGLSSSDADKIKDQKTPQLGKVQEQLLLLWVTDAKDPSYRQLLRGLQKINRMDLVMKIEESDEYRGATESMESMDVSESLGPHSQPSDSSHRAGSSYPTRTTRPQSESGQQPVGVDRIPQQQHHQQPTYQRAERVSRLPGAPSQRRTDAFSSYRDPRTDMRDAVDESFHNTAGLQPSLIRNDGPPTETVSNQGAQSLHPGGGDPSIEGQQFASGGGDNPDGMSSHTQARDVGPTTTSNVRAFGLGSPGISSHSPGPSPRLESVTRTESLHLAPEAAQPTEPSSILADDSIRRKEPAAILNPCFSWMQGRMKVMRQESQGAKQVIVALLDSGIYEDHPNLKAANMIIERRNFVHGQQLDLIKDLHNHGTVSAGVLWQYSPEAKILNLKVLSAEGPGCLLSVVKAMEFIQEWENVTRKVVDIVLMPFGQVLHDDRLEGLLDAMSKTKVIICSASNAGMTTSNTIPFPANHGKVLAIGSCDEHGCRCSHSGVGDELCFLFPGQSITSTSSKFFFGGKKSNKYMFVDGTSFAVPHAGALVAVILAFVEAKFSGQMRKRFTSCRVMKKLLRKTSGRDFSPESGYGMPCVDDLTVPFIQHFINKEGLAC